MSTRVHREDQRTAIEPKDRATEGPGFVIRQRGPEESVTLWSMGVFFRRKAAAVSIQGWHELGLTYEPTIRGESHYQPQLRSLLRNSDRWDAVLVREPNNKFDPNAVQVQIHDQCVGYLAKEDAAELAAQLDGLWHQRTRVGFRARLFGGTSEKPTIGVFIDRND